MPEWPASFQEWLTWVGPNRYAQALLIVVIALIAAKLVGWTISDLLRRLTAHTKTEIDDRLLSLLHKPLFQTVVLAGLGLATLRLELPATPEWLTIGILKSLVVIIWSVLAVRLTRVLLEALSLRAGESQLLQARTVPLFSNLATVVIAGGAVYFLFLSWNIDVTAWLASAGIVGIALGFAAKDTLANLFSGLFILADAPYKVGDFIVLDTGERGQVTQVGLRSTRLLTRDDIEVTIPNAVIANAKIINESGGPWQKQRLRVPVGVAYGSDIDHVKSVLLDIALKHSEVASDPEPRARFRSFGASSLDLELLCWVEEPVLRGSVLDALNTTIYKRFAEEKIQIPFPQRDVYVKRFPSRT
ncbi:MAG: mechanosensitive ion channel family protein [Acidobacteriota bacterium]|nr:MAG: mechanosensitive ion channel family protein [Acidobacteriota bacterium]